MSENTTPGGRPDRKAGRPREPRSKPPTGGAVLRPIGGAEVPPVRGHGGSTRPRMGGRMADPGDRYTEQDQQQGQREDDEFPCGWCSGHTSHRTDCPSWTGESADD